MVGCSPGWKSNFGRPTPSTRFCPPEKYCVDLREPPRHRADAVTGPTSRRWREIATPSRRRSYVTAAARWRGISTPSTSWRHEGLVSTPVPAGPGRHVIQRNTVVAAHGRQRAMLNGALEGRQINLAPRALVYYRVRSDATRLLVVQHIVLRRRYDIMGLDRRDNCRGHPRAEVGVLAAAIFEIATIERNARDVEPRPQ